MNWMFLKCARIVSFFGATILLPFNDFFVSFMVMQIIYWVFKITLWQDSQLSIFSPNYKLDCKTFNWVKKKNQMLKFSNPAFWMCRLMIIDKVVPMPTLLFVFLHFGPYQIGSNDYCILINFHLFLWNMLTINSIKFLSVSSFQKFVNDP